MLQIANDQYWFLGNLTQAYRVICIKQKVGNIEIVSNRYSYFERMYLTAILANYC